MSDKLNGNDQRLGLPEACRIAIAALAPAAKAGQRAKLAEQYEQEWADELARREEREKEAHTRDEEAARQNREAARERRRKRERARRREEKIEKVKQAVHDGDDARLRRLVV